MRETLRVTVYDGKYTVIMTEDGGMRALRYGEEWRDLVGDGMVLALAQEVDELRRKIEEKDRLIARLKSFS